MGIQSPIICSAGDYSEKVTVSCQIPRERRIFKCESAAIPVHVSTISLKVSGMSKEKEKSQDCQGISGEPKYDDNGTAREIADIGTGI